MEDFEATSMNKEEEEWCFYHQLGYAISVWSIVEYELHVIAVLVLKPNDRHIFYSAYTAIENFRSKVAFVERAIVKGTKDENMREEWAVLNDRIQVASAKRNRLAHWACVGYPSSVTSGRRIALEPTYRESEPVGMRVEPPQDALCLLDINALSQDFYQIVLAVAEFARRIAGKPEDPLLRSSVRPVYPLTIRQIEDRMRVAFGRQPRPSRKK